MITIEKCPCGQDCCRDYHLVGIGKFVHGSGFSQTDATRICNIINEEQRTIDFTELLDSQLTLQAKMGHPTGHGEAGVKENLLHVIIETVEAMREINFKPWKTSTKVVDRVALATELTDILQFWANAANAFGLTPQELTDALRAKWQVNYQRIKDQEVKSV
jgi:hypothetical protein